MPPVYFNMETQTPHVSELKSAVTQIRAGIAKLREVQTLMTSMRDGADYSLIESKFSLDAGRGMTLYNMVTQALALVDAADAQNPALDNKLQMLIKRTF
jgi:uncharacterized protein HemX